MNVVGVQTLLPYGIVMACMVLLLSLFRLRKSLLGRLSVKGISIGNGQTMGRREEQDDYFSTATTLNGTIAVLADGISGLSNGRMASTIAVTTFIRQFLKVEKIQQIPAFFTKSARLSNQEILEQLRGSRGGTTLVAAVITQGNLYWGAVGDSILMVYRNGDFIQMNSKDTYELILEQRYLAGQITRADAISDPQKKRLINYLGFEGFRNMEVCREPYRLQKGDKVILCSDGVYETLTEIEIERILTQSRSTQDAAQAIIEAVEHKNKKNQDNATVVILENGW